MADLWDIQDLAIRHMKAHGLDGWTIRFDNAKTRAGVCRTSLRTLSLSAPLMRLWTVPQCEDTILHEIAHALTPHDRGHGYAWQVTARTIGADPTRTWGHSGEARITGRYRGTCPDGHISHLHRRPTRRYVCTTDGMIFTWEDTRP